MVGDIFSVGDIVRVRDYDELENEFEPEDDEGIMCDGRIYFSIDMKYLCGKEYVIRSRDVNDYIDSGFKYKLSDVRGWVFSPGMLELVDPEPDLEASEELDKFLEGWL